MKLKFKQQDFQTAAINAVCSLFEGQRKTTATFGMEQNGDQTVIQTECGIGNALQISTSELLVNMQAVQKRNNLPKTDSLAGNQFSIEMETGTGKTYVYTKTIFELNKQFGFTKFIIVVPSIAIREGVHKSLQITQEHFAALYDNTSCRYFIYNSSKISDVRLFAASSNIEIMIINIDAFRKAENVINQPHEKLSDNTAISHIQSTNPIVIIDEPQSVDSTEKAKEAIASLNPLCVLRYPPGKGESALPADPGGRLPNGIGQADLCVLQPGSRWVQPALHPAAIRFPGEWFPGASGIGRKGQGWSHFP